MSDIERAIIAVIVLILGTVFTTGFNQTRLENYCLSQGYPTAKWRAVGPNYCIKRVDQTDVVVSADSLKLAGR